MELTATIVTETYNYGSGQSHHALARALNAAAAAAVGVGGRSHNVLLIDAGNDRGTAEVVESVRAATGATIQHASVPTGTGYDTMKDVAASMCDTDVVAYLDGDCEPSTSPELWLREMMRALAQPGVTAVSGTTAYEGGSAFQLASSTVDFGFLLDNPGGSIGCYASNNVAFLVEDRRAVRVECHGLRCGCFIHAQKLLRAGTPVFHVSGQDALVRHERVPVLQERLRRGHDAVVVAKHDPTTVEAALLGGALWRSCTIGVFRFTRSQLSRDRVRLPRMAAAIGAPRRSIRFAYGFIFLLRAAEVVGIWGALLAGPSPQWNQSVTFDEAYSSAVESLAAG